MFNILKIIIHENKLQPLYVFPFTKENTRFVIYHIKYLQLSADIKIKTGFVFMIFILKFVENWL